MKLSDLTKNFWGSNVQNIDPAKPNAAAPVGVTGVKISSGYLYEEFLPELQGQRGRKVLREMSENEPIIGAIIYALERIIQSVEWTASPAAEDTTGEYADFAESILHDMDMPFCEFIQEALSEIVYGFSVFEIVYKLRKGKAGSSRSKYDDGRIGIKTLAPRAQDTIERWDVDPDGTIYGFWQRDPNSAKEVYIPINKCLLFRTTNKKNNPEGRSLLRSAYRPWFFKKNLEWVEAIAAERELNGLPVVKIPSVVFQDPIELAKYMAMVRDVKFNEQGGVVLPSDTYKDKDGNPTSIPKVDFQLLSSTGSRAIDIEGAVMRRSQEIAMTLLSDFIMLGTKSGGSFALSKSKTQLFILCIEGLMVGIKNVINRKLLQDVWDLNGFDQKFMPELVHGPVAPQDLQELGDYISNLSRAGMVIGGDLETEKVLRQAAGLPDVIEDPLAGVVMPPEDNSISLEG